MAGPSSLAAYETYKLLPPPEQPYTMEELALLHNILQTAEGEWKAAQRSARRGRRGRGATPRAERMSLLHVLRAYESILQQRGISPDDDTYYYRFLLKLSLDGSNDWFKNFEAEKRLNGQRAVAAQHAKAAALRTALDTWRGATAARRAIELVQSPVAARFQPNGHYEAGPGDRSPPAPAGGLNGHTYRVSPNGAGLSLPHRSPSRSPGSPSRAILQDLSDWVGSEREEWNHSPLKQRGPPRGLDIPSSVQRSAVTSSLGPQAGNQISPRRRVDLNRRASAETASPRNGTDLSGLIPPSSPEDVAAYQDFKGLSDAFRVWSEHMLAVRAIREEKARALELYIDALDSWARKASKQAWAAWHRVVRNNRKQRRHVLKWAWRRFCAAYQALRLSLARLTDALYHWQGKTLRSTWLRWKLAVIPPFREVHPLLVLGILMLRRQGRPRWMSTVDSTELGAYDGDVAKPTHRRRLERGQRALRAWYIETLFCAWVQYTDECFTVLDSAVRHWASRSWTKHFLQWRRYVLAVRHRYERLAAAEHHAGAQNARFVLRGWWNYITRLFAMRKKVAEFFTVTRVLGMARYLQAWAGHCMAEGARRKALVWTLRSKYVRSVLVSWTKRTGDLARRSAAVRAVQKMRHENELNRCFQHWSVHARWKKWCLSNVATGRHRVSHSLQRKTFSRWFTWRAEAQQLRWKMQIVVKRWAMVGCATALRQWVYVCERKRRVQLRFAQYLTNAARHYFSFWVQWKSKMRKVAQATAARVVNRSKIVFDVWNLRTTNRKRLRRQALQVMGFVSVNIQQRSFQSWKYRSKIRALHRAIVAERMTATNCRYAFVTLEYWKGWAKRHVMISTMLHGQFVRREVVTKMERFGRWRWYVSMERAGRAAAFVHAAFFKRELWAGWKVARKGEAARKVCEPIYKRQLLIRWREWAKYSRRTSKIMNRIISKWQRKSTRSSFRNWLAYLDLLDEQAEAAKHCAGMKAFKRLFPPWAASARTSLATKKKFEGILLSKWMSLSRQAFECWRRHSTHRKAKRTTAVRIALHRCSSVVARALCTWQANVAAQLQEAKQLKAAQCMDGQRMCRSAFGAWAGFVKLRQSVKLWLEQARLFDNARAWIFVQKLLMEWKQYTNNCGAQQLRKAAALRFWMAVAKGPAMRAWKGYVARMKLRKEALAASIGKWDSTMLATLQTSEWAGFAGYRVATTGASASIRRYLLRSCVSVWIDYTEVHRKLRNAVFQLARGKELRVIKFCLDTWKVRAALWKWMSEAQVQSHLHWYYRLPFRKWTFKSNEWRRLRDAAANCEAKRRNQVRRRYLRVWNARYALRVGFLAMCHAQCIKSQQQALEAWRKFTGSSKALRAKLVVSVAWWRNKRLFEHFLCWTSFTLLTKQMKMMMSKAEHFLRPRMVRFLWDSFVSGVTARRDKRKLMLIALMHDVHSHLIKVMILWQEWLGRKLRRNALKKISESFFLKRELQRWKEWTRIKIERETKTFMALKYLSDNSARKCLTGWRHAVETQKRLRVTMRAVLERQVSRKERETFSRWRNLMYAARLHYFLVQKRAVTGWHDFVDKERKVRLVCGRIENAVVARVLGSWRVLVVQSQRVDNLLAITNRKIAGKLFRLWHFRRTQQMALRIFASRAALTFLAMNWSAFREGLANSAAAEVHLQQVVCKSLHTAWYQCYSLRVMIRWAHYAHICAICQKIQVVAADKILREIIAGWWKYTAKQMRLRCIHSQILRQLRNRLTSTAWHGWRIFADRSIMVKTFAIGVLTTSIQRRFDRWLRHTSICSRMSRLVAAGIARHRVLVLQSHLHKWLALTRLLQHIRHLIGQRQAATTRKIFSHWVIKIDRKIELRAAVSSLQTEIRLRPVCGSVALECMHRWATLELQVPFVHWARVCQIKKTQSAALRTGLMNLFARWLRRCFTSWVSWVEIRKKSIACMANLRFRGLKLAFDLWCDVVVHGKLLRIKLRDAIVHREAFVHCMAFSVWRRQVRVSQGVLFMLHHRAYRYVTQAFAEWSIRTVITANKSHKIFKARCHWALALLFGTFSSWAEGVAAIKMSKHFLTLHRLHLASVRLDQHLRAWHRTASRRHYLRTASIWMWARNYQARYLTGWLLVVASSIAMKHKALLAIMNVRRRFFMKWRQVARRRAGIYAVTKIWWTAFSVRTCFNEWTRHATLCKMYLIIERQFYDTRKPQVLRAHLRHWQLTAQAEVAFKRIMHQFTPVRNFHGLLAHFQAWWKMTGVLQRDRIVKVEIEALHAEYVQYSSLQQWRKQYKLKLRFRRHRYKHFCLKAIAAWHVEADRSTRSKAAIYRLRNRASFKAFSQWRAMVTEKKRLKQLANTLIQQLLHQCTRRAFLTWRSFVTERIHMVDCLSKATKRWTHGTQLNIFGCMLKHTAQCRHLHRQIEKSCGHYNNVLLRACSRAFFLAAGHLVRIQRFALKVMHRQHLEIYAVAWEPWYRNWEKKSWARALLAKFKPIILRRCIRCWILGNVVNRLDFGRDDQDKELNTEIRALLAEGDRVAARQLAIHRNLISRWQMKYYSWVFTAFTGRMRKVNGCRRVLQRMQNLAFEAAFQRWKGLTIAIYRGRELKAWRDIGRIAEGFEAWQWLHGKILAVNAGIMRRALGAWHHRMRAEIRYMDGLAKICGKYGKVLGLSETLHMRLLRKILQAWQKAAHKATVLLRALLNGRCVLSGYRFFKIWQHFLQHRCGKRATCARQHERCMLRSSFAAWRIIRAQLNGDKILMRCFSHTSSFIRKRLAVERWKLHNVNKHRIYVHRALVLRHRRQMHLQTRAAIARERARLFWDARNEAYEAWKNDRRSTVPTMWNTGVAESPRHLISSITADQMHPLEHSPVRKKLFKDETLRRDVSKPSVGGRRARPLSSAFVGDRSSLSVPQVSQVDWIQQEFEQDIKLYKQRQDEDLNDIIKSMKRADVLLLVDMYINGKNEREMLIPFIAWKDYARVFGWNALKTKRYELHFVTLNWNVSGFDRSEKLDQERLNHVRTAYALWLIRTQHNKIQKQAMQHKARMHSRTSNEFKRSGNQASTIRACLRAWRSAISHLQRAVPVLEQRALNYFRKVRRRSVLRNVWAVWKNLHLHFTFIRHARNNFGSVNMRVVFGGMQRYLARRRLKYMRQAWATGRYERRKLRTSFILWLVMLQGVNANPSNDQHGLRLVPINYDSPETLDSLEPVNLANLDSEHEVFVHRTAAAGRRLGRRF